GGGGGGRSLRHRRHAARRRRASTRRSHRRRPHVGPPDSGIFFAPRPRRDRARDAAPDLIHPPSITAFNRSSTEPSGGQGCMYTRVQFSSLAAALTLFVSVFTAGEATAQPATGEVDQPDDTTLSSVVGDAPAQQHDIRHMPMDRGATMV